MNFMVMEVWARSSKSATYFIVDDLIKKAVDSFHVAIHGLPKGFKKLFVFDHLGESNKCR